MEENEEIIDFTKEDAKELHSLMVIINYKQPTLFHLERANELTRLKLKQEK